MGHAIIRGNTVEEKFESANKALMQLERRIAARSIVAPLTPIIVMGYCDQPVDGVIAKGMFPVSGFITKVSLFIESLEDPEYLKKNSLKFYMQAHQADGTVISKEFSSRELSIKERSNFKIAADSRVTVSLDVKVSGIWYGFVMEPETPIKRAVDVSDTDVLSPTELEEIEV